MKSGISQQAVLSAGGIENTFLGAVTENYVAQALRNNGYGLYYWTSDGTAELDFVLQKGGDIIAVEVKTGARVKSRSQNMFVTKYKPAYSIRISARNFGFENNIQSVPLYTKQELEVAKTSLASTLRKCEKIQEGGKLQFSQKTLNDRRVNALRVCASID
jgi:Holliday junction resolvase-like predicted endonuclease